MTNTSIDVMITRPSQGGQVIVESVRDAVMTARQYDSPVERAIGAGTALRRPSYIACADRPTAPRTLSWQNVDRGSAQIYGDALSKGSAMKLRVYLVEDSAIMSPLLRTLIEGTGARIVGSSGAAPTAIEDIAVLRPDVVVIDIGLREGSGFDVLRALSRSQENERPTRVVLTNHVLEPLREAATRWGASHFFDKSREIPQMLRVLRAMRRSLRVSAAS